jgi:phospholipid/cholesterol/gamma-HCH transport system substrate-binding protein
MRGRRGGASVAANPVLIGAATVLVVVVAVFLAYNANNGLPFIPTYQLTAEVPSAANLVEGNDVRIGGARVGVVDQITPKLHKGGRVTALLRMKLETRIRPLSKDTTVLIRPRSALGLKYIQLTPGDKAQAGTLEDGATIPVANATPQPVEIDEVFNTFDARTRKFSRENLRTFSEILAGRGKDLNLAIHDLAPLLANLEPVARNLSDPKTNLRGFVRSLSRTTALLAPVAETQADLFGNLATTFGALAQVKTDLQASISEGPPTLEAAVRAFRIQRPFLANSAALFRDLAPGARALGRYAPTIQAALVAGTDTLPRTVPLSRELARTLTSLRGLADDPQARLGIDDTTRFAKTLDPPLTYLAPAQITCNYVTLFFRNASDLLSVGGPRGTWQRFSVLPTPPTPPSTNGEGGPSTAPANGPALTVPAFVGVPQGNVNHLHANFYPNTASPGQPRECEAGNESYDVGKVVIGHDPGTQAATTEKTTRDADAARRAQKVGG